MLGWVKQAELREAGPAEITASTLEGGRWEGGRDKCDDSLPIAAISIDHLLQLLWPRARCPMDSGEDEPDVTLASTTILT